MEDKQINDVMRVMSTSSRICELQGQAKVLVECGRLVDAAMRLDEIAAAYVEYANILRDKAAEINGQQRKQENIN